jgi:hypothetical protein
MVKLGTLPDAFSFSLGPAASVVGPAGLPQSPRPRGSSPVSEPSKCRSADWLFAGSTGQKNHLVMAEGMAILQTMAQSAFRLSTPKGQRQLSAES